MDPVMFCNLYCSWSSQNSRQGSGSVRVKSGRLVFVESKSPSWSSQESKSNVLIEFGCAAFTRDHESAKTQSVESVMI